MEDDRTGTSAACNYRRDPAGAGRLRAARPDGKAAGTAEDAGHLDGLVERNGRDVERLREEIVIQIVIGASLADVGRHADRVEHEIEFAPEVLHRLVDQVLQIPDARGVGRNDDRIALLGQLRDGSHAD